MAPLVASTSPLLACAAGDADPHHFGVDTDSAIHYNLRIRIQLFYFYADSDLSCLSLKYADPELTCNADPDPQDCSLICELTVQSAGGGGEDRVCGLEAGVRPPLLPRGQPQHQEEAITSGTQDTRFFHGVGGGELQ
jgi:hypothetical protein